MDDFLDDDALLAMVGDESNSEVGGVSSAEGDRQQSLSPPPKARSPTPETSTDQPASASNSQPRTSTATKKMSAKGSARGRKASESPARDASSRASSPAESLGSDAMDESDDDADADDYAGIADEETPYPLDGKYKNAADKAYVQGLPELEREALLAEREEEAEQKRRNAQLKSLVTSGAADASKKRKAAGDIDDVRAAKKKPETELDRYKKEREEAKSGRRTTAGRSSRLRRSRSRDSDASYDRDAGGSPDIPAPVSAPSREPDLPVELADADRLRVGRSRLAEICFKPNFDSAVVGCFVRVCIGQNEQRQNEYRMTRVKEVVTGNPYLVDAEPAVPKFYTDQYLLLAHGKAQKQWSFMHCSDSRFTDREFHRWQQQLTVDGLPQVHKSEAEKVLKGVHAIVDHHLTSDEINRKIELRNKYRHLFSQAASNAPKITKSDDQAEKIRLRNEKTRKDNSEQVRKAEMAKRVKHKQFLMKQQAAKKAAEANGSLAVPIKDDIDALFSEGSDISRAASPAPGSGTATPQRKFKSGRFVKMTTDDEVLGAMELEIDVDI